jgi:hypothetical protein
MKLAIRRDQQAVKGVLGGHKGVQFTLSCRLMLTTEESALVEQYRLGDFPLTWRTYQGTQVPGVTIGSLQTGYSVTLSDVTTLVSNENAIKNACDKIPVLFSLVKSFGGEEVIEYPRDEAAVAATRDE